MSSSEYSVTSNDENLVSEKNKFDESTCSGDSVCGILDHNEDNITENYIIWVNTNKSICQEKVIKITFSDLPQDSN